MKYDSQKGTPVYANTYAVLMNEDLWEDPEQFNPDRFIQPDGNIDKVKADRVRIVFLPGKIFNIVNFIT